MTEQSNLYRIERLERRECVRLDARTKIMYRPENETEFQSGVTVNFSGSGVLFETTTNFKIGDILEITIGSPDNKVSHFRALSKVVRIEDVLNENFNKVAVHVTKLIK